MGDKIKLKGVMSKGYGTVPKLVMQDKDIDPEAKAIYAYICSFAGAGTSAFPGISIMCKELPMSEKRFHKFKNQLIKKGYLHIERERKSDGSGWGNNIYHLVQEIPDEKPVTRQNDMIQPVTGQFVTLQNVTRQDVTLQNDMTINNSFTNNSSINNSSIKQQQQPASDNQTNFITAWKENGFGDINQGNIKTLEEWISKFDGNDSVVIKAIKVANELGEEKRNINYLKTILIDWKNRGFKVGEDFDAAEEKRKSEKQAKKAAPRNNFNKGTVRKETIPEHILNPVTKETPMSEEDKQEFMERLKKIQSFSANEQERAEA